MRNRIESEGICIEDSSNYQNVVGNEIVKGSILWDTDKRYPHRIDAATLFIHGNYVDGSIQWDEDTADRTIPVTYYLNEKPDYYGSLEWPSTGSDKPDGTNPARERYYGNTIPPATPTPVVTVRYGDVNGDDEVDSTDLTLLKRYVLRKIDDFPYSEGEISADLDGDGEINSTDLTLLKRYILRRIDKFPVEQN